MRTNVMLASTVMSLVAAFPQGAEARVYECEPGEACAFGQRYTDGLDTRFAAQQLAQSTTSLGYSGRGFINPKSAELVMEGTTHASVLAYFGHGGPGYFLTQESPRQFVAAGTDTTLPSTDGNIRYWNSPLLATQYDDIRLAIIAACNSANTHPTFGDFEDVGRARGIDAMIAFPDLIYYPDTAAGTATSQTNYSGNYFWDRFFAYMQNGKTVSVALAQARTDLVAKEGKPWGYEKYRVTGSVQAPGQTKLAPAGEGTALTYRPTGLEPYVPQDLTTVSVRNDATPLGALQEVTTSEGVVYRINSVDGALVDLVAPAREAFSSTMLSDAELRSAALNFISAVYPEFDPDNWSLSARPTSHSNEASLMAYELSRSSGFSSQGIDEKIALEIDRKTGAVTYYAALAKPANGSPAVIERDQAVGIAESLTTGRAVDATLDRWGTARWFVTVELPDLGSVARTEVVSVDAATAAVLSRETT